MYLDTIWNSEMEIGRWYGGSAHGFVVDTRANASILALCVYEPHPVF